MVQTLSGIFQITVISTDHTLYPVEKIHGYEVLQAVLTYHMIHWNTKHVIFLYEFTTLLQVQDMMMHSKLSHEVEANILVCL